MRLGTLFGIDVYVHSSWLIVLILFTVTLSVGWLPMIYPHASVVSYILLGLLASLLLFVCILLHEVGHARMARARGLQVQHIVLFVFGGVAHSDQEAKTPGVEFQVAVMGPLISLGLGLLFFLFWIPVRGTPSPVSAVLEILAFSNTFIGLFNLIPGYPLDGGRIVRSIVWKITGSPTKSVRVTAQVGVVCAYLLIIWGIFQAFSHDLLNGIWIGFVGWFLLTAAQSTRMQADFDETFGGMIVREVMSQQYQTVPANIAIQKLVDEHLFPHALRSVLVLQGEQFAGMVTIADVMRVPHEQWAHTPVGLVMIPAERLHTVTPDQTIKEALPLMSARDVNQLPVLENGSLVGVLSRDTIIRSLQMRRRPTT